jgi:translation initiation factor IF-2
VRRKRVSLLEKKRAIESGAKVEGGGAGASGHSVWTHAEENIRVGTLSSEEVNARLRAIRNAKNSPAENSDAAAQARVVATAAQGGAGAVAVQARAGANGAMTTQDGAGAAGAQGGTGTARTTTQEVGAAHAVEQNKSARHVDGDATFSAEALVQDAEGAHAERGTDNRTERGADSGIERGANGARAKHVAESGSGLADDTQKTETTTNLDHQQGTNQSCSPHSKKISDKFVASENGSAHALDAGQQKIDENSKNIVDKRINTCNNDNCRDKDEMDDSEKRDFVEPKHDGVSHGSEKQLGAQNAESSEAVSEAKDMDKNIADKGGSVTRWSFSPNAKGSLSVISKVSAVESGGRGSINIGGGGRPGGGGPGGVNAGAAPGGGAVSGRGPYRANNSTDTGGVDWRRRDRDGGAPRAGGTDAGWRRPRTTDRSVGATGRTDVVHSLADPVPGATVVLRDESYGRSQNEIRRQKEAEENAAVARAGRTARGERPRVGSGEREAGVGRETGVGRGEAGRQGRGAYGGPRAADGEPGRAAPRKHDATSNIKEGLPGPTSSEGRFGKVKVKRSPNETDGGGDAARRTRRTFEEPRKLSRRVITRVLDDEDEGRVRSVASFRRAQKKRLMVGQKAAQAKVIRDVVISETITVGELANRMAVSSGVLIKALMKLGLNTSINQVIDGDTAELVCVEFGHRPKRVSSDLEVGLRRMEDDSESKRMRPPVVTVMGHVDHGKTSLLDALRQTDVVSGESGRITQHIGAYQVVVPVAGENTRITFIDTPGHAAFSEMRARGAGVTDIVILVVAADDGVKAQTIEAISHAKAANVPIVLAINKIDKPAANSQQVRNELLNFDIVTEDFGGDVMSVEISAKNGTHLDKLLETVLLQAELLELKANPLGHAEGIVVEASMDKGRGVSATLLVQRGTLKQGDVIVAGGEFGRVKTMTDSYGKRIKDAQVSCPVEVLGFNGVPFAGDEFFVVEEEAKAREVAAYRKQVRKEKEILSKNQNSVADMMQKIASANINELSIVLKTDVQGTLEALSNGIKKLNIEGVVARIVHTGIGDINETDIMLAKAAKAVVFGFHVKATPQARLAANKDKIFIGYHSVVYDLLEKLEDMLKKCLAPTFEEQVLGRAEIRVVFSKGKVTKIAGCYVLSGLIKKANAKIRIIRQNDTVFTGEIDSMKREKDDIKESKEGYECGIITYGFNDIKEGDIIECFCMIEKSAK